MVAAQFAVLLELATGLVRFYGPDDRIVEINPQQVVAVREPRGPERIVHQHIGCLIFTTDGKFIGVKEDCKTVIERLQIAPP